MTVITLTNVSKRYGDNQLFDNLNVGIERGRFYGLVGPNGSGKSVLFKIMCGFVRPDGGSATISAEFLSKRRVFPDEFGVMIDGPAYLPFETGFENLHRLARIRKRITEDDVRTVMREVGLDPAAPQKARRYSLGMKQKLSLAQALMEDPEVLILDEPFNALDAEAVVDVKKILRRRHEAGATIIFTSHNRDDIDELAEDILVLRDRKIEVEAASDLPRSA